MRKGFSASPRFAEESGKKPVAIRIVRYTKDIRRDIVQGSFLERTPAEGKVLKPLLEPEAGAIFGQTA